MRPTKTVDQMVYEAIQAQCKKSDSERTDLSTFATFLQRHLIPEVRQETHAFYGHLDTQEAKYPGLDYTHPTHRIRLSRWRWHRKLFRAFDSLRLTDHEISSLTHWEGTKWAKEKYEKEQGIKIRDTTADGFPDAADIPDWYPTKASSSHRTAGVSTFADHDSESRDSMEIESEDELESVGLELNERLRAQAARREAGDTDAVLDEEWEQWLKTVIESGQLASLTEEIFREGNEERPPILPAGMRLAALAGNWSEIPEVLHPMLRRTLDTETPTPALPRRRPTARNNRNAFYASLQEEAVRVAREAPTPRSSNPQDVQAAGSIRRHLMEDPVSRIRVPWPRRTYSDLRLPVGDAGTGHRAAEASGV
ncbi:Fc.00g023160.m01.CDS01 [Cosmosporella sp. VM-42]